MRMDGFEIAKNEMNNSDFSGNAHIGCAVYYKGNIIAKGFNSNKTSPVQERYNVYRYRNEGDRYYPAKNHAEISTLKKIRNLDIDFSKVRVYTYRELKDGKIANSRPCPSCLAFIKQLGIKQIYYTTNDGYAKEKLERL